MPSLERRRTALFARVLWTPKLMAVAVGIHADAVSPGQTRRFPAAPVWVTVRFTATARAVAGTLQTPAIGKTRLEGPVARAGPPQVPAALRVSITRQGATVRRLVPFASFARNASYPPELARTPPPN